jgi:hypothetical protein
MSDAGGASSGSEAERSESDSEFSSALGRGGGAGGGAGGAPFVVRCSASGALRLLRGPFVELLKSATPEVNVDMVAMSVALAFVMSFMSEVREGPLRRAFADTSSAAFVGVEDRTIRDDSEDYLSAADRRLLDAGRRGRRAVCKKLMKYAREFDLAREAMLYFLYNELVSEISLPSMPRSQKIVRAALFVDEILDAPASVKAIVSFGRDGSFECSELAACVAIGWMCNSNKSLPLQLPAGWFSAPGWSDAQSSISQARPPPGSAGAWAPAVGSVVSLADGDEKAFRNRVSRMQSQKMATRLPQKRPSSSASESVFSEGSSMRRMSPHFVSLEMSTNADELLGRITSGARTIEDIVAALTRIGMDGKDVRESCEARMAAFHAKYKDMPARPCVFAESERSAVRRAHFKEPESAAAFATGVRTIGPAALLPASTWLAVATGGSDALLSGPLAAFRRDVEHARLAELFVFAQVAPRAKQQ